MSEVLEACGLASVERVPAWGAVGLELEHGPGGAALLTAPLGYDEDEDSDEDEFFDADDDDEEGDDYDQGFLDDDEDEEELDEDLEEDDDL